MLCRNATVKSFLVSLVEPVAYLKSELPARRTAQTGEGGRNTDRADVCPDPRRPAAVPEESRGGLFSWVTTRSEEHTSELQSQSNLVCRLLLEKKKKNRIRHTPVVIFSAELI